MNMGDPSLSKQAAASPAPKEASPRVANPCAHCGQLLLHGTFRDAEGKAFCCQGCLQVHALLADAPWGNRFNDLLEQSGRRAPQADAGEDYRAFLASLDDPARLADVGRREGSKHSLTLESRDITCAACGWLLENLLREAPGVEAFEVDFLHGEVFIRYDSAARTLKSLLSDLSGFGYRLRPKAGYAPARPAPDRAMLYRIAVSGACFANAMAFSLANYVGFFQGMSAGWQKIFGAMGLALALPSVAYAAFPFYAGAWRVLRAGRFNIDVTVTLGILMSLAVTVASVAGGAAGNFSDSLAGLVFFLLLGRWGVRRFEAGLALKGRWFEALRPGKVKVMRNGAALLVDCAEVKEGEVVEVEAGEHVPLDGVLNSHHAWMDSGLLTGESRPVRLQAGDPVFAGTVNLKGAISLLVTGVGGATRIAGLGRQLEKLAADRRPLKDGAAQVARWFTLAVAALALLALFLHRHEGLTRALSISATVFIISCSCALALAVPICRGLGLKRARDLGFHFKSQQALEAVREVRCVLLDKTGTMTFTRRAVSSWTWLAPFDAGDGSDLGALKTIKALARHSLHPVAVSLQRALETLDDTGVVISRMREIEHFGMVGGMREGRWKSICVCRYGAWNDTDGAFAGLGYPRPSRVDGSPLPPGDACVFLDGVPAAVIRFTDEMKPDAPELVRALEAKGVTVVLLSGDNEEKVSSFARACGIADYHANLDPDAKQFWAARYKSRHGRTLAVGDGFNDSLLFGASDLAMAIQGGAVDLSPGTDILFTGTRLSALDRLFALSRGVSGAVKLCYWVSAAYNSAAIGAALMGAVTPLTAAILMPMSSLSICLAAWLRIPASKPT
jgi:Cu2+-exporting ATPase